MSKSSKLDACASISSIALGSCSAVAAATASNSDIAAASSVSTAGTVDDASRCAKQKNLVKGVLGNGNIVECVLKHE